MKQAMKADGASEGLGQCELCKRDGVLLTRHHLIPRMRHRQKRTRRLFDREQMTGRILLVCRPCHSHIHHTFTEKELADRFSTLDALLTHPEISKFVTWISTKAAGFKPKSRGRKR